MTFREVERLLLNNGWRYKNAKGSHNHYVHPQRPGKVTIPNHTGDIPSIVVKSILKQAGITRSQEMNI